jgi:hypothetical protein
VNGDQVSVEFADNCYSHELNIGAHPPITWRYHAFSHGDEWYPKVGPKLKSIADMLSPSAYIDIDYRPLARALVDLIEETEQNA